MAIEECEACELSDGRSLLPGGLIHRQHGWRVEHCVGPLGLGTLIVKPERHVTAVGDLTVEEATGLGPLLRSTSRVAGQLVESEQVYNCLWSHAGGRPVHIHYVVQPITALQMARHGAHGPRLQVAMFTKEDRPPADEIETVCDEARRLFAER